MKKSISKIIGKKEENNIKNKNKIKNKLKSEKGISLVTLGVAIIVLIILSTITMRQLKDSTLMNDLVESENQVNDSLKKGQSELDKLKAQYDQI